MKEIKKENEIFTIDKEIALVNALRKSELNNNDHISISIENENTKNIELEKSSTDSAKAEKKKKILSFIWTLFCCCSRKTENDSDKKVSKE